ncbi:MULTISPECIES: NTP transferase domain-containing protein [Wolbachia]|uniref:Glycosyl transferase family 2 n=1 Tax=Wolbachia pipientis TaxID=955 RepID=A0A6C1U3S1_WOLPI|nr:MULTISPECIES: NTP transferase domain-containing protein [Wolbachia]QDW09201.1 glycosyl transferase family 2 [Wolbachia pipientis]THA20200.1 glycosyl transferase family 2 [Wolbachia endosymbiont of Aedes albopictus]QBB84406.1 glycosyl transferase family 2 [Wolbachia pipientis wAlbB]QCB62841.1 glycosyl transferase family 2 [Wolbachia endosymbiont of Drosophila mauritiana]QCB63886.1 glycosyl transferase family 2 [Wolbachia endosymbiont of Drosophila mauritiana]
MSNILIILAAGKSSRMNSEYSKALHQVGNLTLLEHIISNAKLLSLKSLSIVVNNSLLKDLENFDTLKSIIDQYNIKLIIQEDITGTGTAVKIALENLEELSDQDIVLIQYGDTPFISSDTVMKMTDCLKYNNLVLLGFNSQDEQYGRLVIDNYGNVQKILKNGDKMLLANSGIIASYAKDLSTLVKEIKFNNSTNEYCLNDIVPIAATNNLSVGYVVTDEREAMGVNNKEDLVKAEHYFQATTLLS